MKQLVFYVSCLLAFGFSNAQINISFVEFANGLNSPVDLQNAGDDRLFVVEQGGRIKIIDANGTVRPTPFLNISSQVSTGGEQGLLGLAFHPDYATNGYYYVNYTKTNGDSRISRFSVDPGNPDLTLAGSEFVIIEYSQPFSNHNGGGIAFGQDGYLYISTGDGGSGGDPGNRAQNTTILLGKILRLDIDNPGGGSNYGIPPDNPFAGSTVNAEEIWAYGLRNPWRFSFDSLTGDLWIGDVGQSDVEEIDKAESTEAGLNYGWRCYEGSTPFNTAGCPNPSELTFPVAEYSSSSGSGNCSVTGGYVYRGTNHPNEYGLYFAADVCSGKVFTVDDQDNLTDWGSFGGSWVSFGVDVNNELYIVDIGGKVYQFVGTILGINEVNTSALSLIPNPALDQVLVRLENDTISSIFITTVQGRDVFTKEYIHTEELRISVSDLNSGMYFVRIVTESDRTITKKLVLK